MSVFIFLVDFTTIIYYNKNNKIKFLCFKEFLKLLDEYKELCRVSAEIIPGWTHMSKNDLCRAYVANKSNPVLQNAYMSAILYKYWNLIGKYYYMSSNCVSPEECYEWLVDSVSCCVNLASWENPESTIYNDPNGPDKVINRCMKCARLTYYQFINRKKRKDDFNILSIDELRELFGNGCPEPSEDEQEFDLGSFLIREYILEEFRRKNYFVCFLLQFVISENVFDVVSSKQMGKFSQLNIRKICRMLCNITEEQIQQFCLDNKTSIQDTRKAVEYIRMIPPSKMRKKVLQALEDMKHSSLVESLAER